MPASAQTILVLGGGVGGVVAAVELRKRLSDAHRIVLVEREERHVFQPSLQEDLMIYLVGVFDQDQTSFLLQTNIYCGRFAPKDAIDRYTQSRCFAVHGPTPADHQIGTPKEVKPVHDCRRNDNLGILEPLRISASDMSFLSLVAR